MYILLPVGRQHAHACGYQYDHHATKCSHGYRFDVLPAIQTYSTSLISTYFPPNQSPPPPPPTRPFTHMMPQVLCSFLLTVLLCPCHLSPHLALNPSSLPTLCSDHALLLVSSFRAACPAFLIQPSIVICPGNCATS